ncbi:hypothetical protein F5X99DRAFT_208468 [Biscogniauxia marginata]|nr:hypothetical protein F5X99DRAFT_208468 [Biscogniauxia marginata]
MAPSSQTTPQPPSSAENPTNPAPVLASKPPFNRHDKIISASELTQIASNSLQTGAVTGGIGLIVGAGSGIVRSAPPALFALVSGIQWFALGSSFMASRTLLWHAWGGEENLSSGDFVTASGIAGGVSGMVGGMLRGPKNVIPGVLVFSSLGAASSYFSQKTKRSEPKPASSWLDSKWSPMKRLSDKEYEEKLEEKLLRLDAEIAIIDESIELLKASSQESATSKKEPTTQVKK